MTIWVLHEKLTPEQENTIQDRTHVILPFEGLPDLSMVGTQAGFLHLLRVLHPDAPPETIARLMDQTWNFYSTVHQEDILAIPLPARQEVALAEVTGPYRHSVDENRADIHMLPVKWHEKRIPLRNFKKFPGMFDATPGRLAYEVENPQARIIIRDRMPHGYNRFAGLKWLLIVFFAWRLIDHLMHMGTSVNDGLLP